MIADDLSPADPVFKALMVGRQFESVLRALFDTEPTAFDNIGLEGDAEPAIRVSEYLRTLRYDLTKYILRLERHEDEIGLPPRITQLAY